MTTLHSLTTRLTALSDSYKTTLQLINRLAKLSFQPGSAPLNSEDGDVRVELTSDIHESLKQQEEELELLRQEVEDFTAEEAYSGSYQRRRESEREREKVRLRVQVARLGEDLKSARAQFRIAQLQAKRSADTAKCKERELLLQSYQQAQELSRSASPTSSTDLTASGTLVQKQRRRGPEKLTEDELLVNASSDVTAALRRTQQLMHTELQRSQFAQETFDRSTAELQQLGEHYSDLDSLLNSSRTLLGTLLRSQKSDTWYLETAFYILAGTIAWLLYRRLLYGPLWWLVWLPLKLSYKFVGAIFAAVGLTTTSSSLSAASGGATTSLKIQPSASDPPPSFAESAGRAPPYIPVGRGGGAAPSPPPEQQQQQTQPPQDPSPEGSLSQEIGQMAEQKQGGKETVVRGDGTVLKESDEPRNPKKRMFDTEVEREKTGEAKGEAGSKEKVVRGDGTVLEERNDEPVNSKKRVMDTGADGKGKERDEL